MTLNGSEGKSKTRRLRPELGSNSPAQRRSSYSAYSTAQVAAAMLGRPEDTGGTRTLKLARGQAESPGVGPKSPKSISRHGSDQGGYRTPCYERQSGHHGTQLLSQVGIIEFLQQDDRPTMVVDLADDLNNVENKTLQLLYTNSALKERHSLQDQVQGMGDDITLMLPTSNTFAEFKTWVLGGLASRSAPSTDTNTSFSFAEVAWKRSTIRKQLAVISGQPVSTTPPGQESRRRPLLKTTFNGLGSSNSAGVQEHATQAEAPGYFDTKTVGRPGPAETPGRMVMLYQTSSNSDASVPSHDDPNLTALNVSPTTNGDAGISELLMGPLSPASMQRLFPPEPYVPEVQDGVAIPIVSADRGFFDWTRMPESATTPEHIRFARSIDWAATSLGPMDTWCADLRAMCNLIVASPHPAAMYWGPDHVAIYNEAYVDLAGRKHPALMGSRYEDAWVEIWSAIADVFATAMTSAQSTMKDDDCLFIQRVGSLEETYFSWSIIPLIGEDGNVVGLYNPAFENTRRKIAERRMLTLREIGERTASAREVSQFWALLIEGLEYNEFDAPLVMVYSLADDGSDDASVSSGTLGSNKQCVLEGALGIEAGHQACPEKIDLKTGTEGFGTAFRQAIRSEAPIVLSEEDGSLDPVTLEDIQWRGFNQPSRNIVICPVRPTTGDSTLGFLVMGTNPFRPYDEDYILFVQLLGRQLATSIASVVLFEEEIRRGEQAAKMAAQDRIELSTQLAARTQEAVDSETKFTRMAELAPVGIFIANSQGNITYCNDAWYEISRHPRQEITDTDSWMSTVHPDDLPLATGAWSACVREKVPMSIQFRFRHPWRDKSGNTGETWVLGSAFPETGHDGQLKSIFGSITDISTQKFAEGIQKRRMEEAMELKRQQENFIDITSHEMRNPLSAILQCADEISTSLLELKVAGGLSDALAEQLESNIDAAQTITLCAQHQKRIVDDVLTLSKLDSAMLLVTPVDVQPVTVVQRALKMFEGELQSADIILDFRVHESFHSHKIDWVRLDPSRLLQVLINLTTNAIKFTTTQEKRTIIVHLAASSNGPTEEDRQSIKYIPSRKKSIDTTAKPDWGTGEVVYVHFAVQDTGRGLSDTEKNVLFQRFSQASPRTHITYGGSGLGLFISRELVELQGGEIGVSSESGKGSTFAFYIKARRSSAPAKDSDEGIPSFTPGRKSSHMKLRGSNLRTEVNINILPAEPSVSHPPAASFPSSDDTSTPTISTDPASTLKILIVEDNLVNQRVLAKQLRKAGCIVYLANHGGEAIELVQTSRFWHANSSNPSAIDINVILMDLEMPVMDGTTCARKLRELQVEGKVVKHIPVIAVTANAREEQIKTTLEAGNDDVVSKPFRVVQDLLPKIRSLMARFDAEGEGESMK